MTNGDVLKLTEIANLNVHFLHKYLANRADRLETDEQIRNEKQGVLKL